MFEKIVIRRNHDFVDVVDAGAILESILFYDTVHMVFDTPSLLQSAKIFGLAEFVSMLRDNLIVGTLFWDYFASLNNDVNGIRYSNLAAFQARGMAGQKRRPTDREHLTTLLERQFGKSRQTRKAADTILDLVPVRNMKKNNALEEIISSARLDIQDSAYVRAAATLVFEDLVPGYRLPDNWEFEVVPLESDFIINTNINFEKVNEIYRKNPLFKDDTMNGGHILVALVNARADMFFCSDYMAEFMSTPIASGLMKLRLKELIKRRGVSAEELELFQEITLGNSKAIREVFNSGERTLSEIRHLLDGARRFKTDFLKVANPDEGLIREYQAALTRESWADKLPSKIKRFSVFAGASLLGELLLPSGVSTAVGVTLCALDDILIDRLIKGWRPNQFIDGPLRDFVQPRV
jgi:hypothetical protein